MTIGIDFVETKPLQCQAAVWDPEDARQRGTVLGWLLGHNVPYSVHPNGTLILFPQDPEMGHPVYFGEYVVISPETGDIGVYDLEVYEANFQNAETAYDPNQPSIFSLPEFLERVFSDPLIAAYLD